MMMMSRRKSREPEYRLCRRDKLWIVAPTLACAIFVAGWVERRCDRLSDGLGEMRELIVAMDKRLVRVEERLGITS